jgi:hypothetical protein
MDRFLQPQRFDCTSDDPQATSQWILWFRTFCNFVEQITSDNKSDNLHLLINLVSPSVYNFISDVKSYEAAIKTLENIYVKPKNTIFSRHQLYSRKQFSSESVSQYVMSCRLLARECQFKNISVPEHNDLCVLDTFISGLTSNNIRQRLLEQSSLILQSAVDCALSIEASVYDAATYNNYNLPNCFSAVDHIKKLSENITAAILHKNDSQRRPSCFFVVEPNIRKQRHCSPFEVTENARIYSYINGVIVQSNAHFRILSRGSYN